jgi:hypothetical protein
VTSMATSRWYQMVTVVTGEDVMSAKPIATEGHSNDGWFGDITEKSLYKRITRWPLLKSHPPPPTIATEAFCSSDSHFITWELIRVQPNL